MGVCSSSTAANESASPPRVSHILVSQRDPHGGTSPQAKSIVHPEADQLHLPHEEDPSTYPTHHYPSQHTWTIQHSQECSHDQELNSHEQHIQHIPPPELSPFSSSANTTNGVASQPSHGVHELAQSIHNVNVSFSPAAAHLSASPQEGATAFLTTPLQTVALDTQSCRNSMSKQGTHSRDQTARGQSSNGLPYTPQAVDPTGSPSARYSRSYSKQQTADHLAKLMQEDGQQASLTRNFSESTSIPALAQTIPQQEYPICTCCANAVKTFAVVPVSNGNVCPLSPSNNGNACTCQDCSTCGVHSKRLRAKTATRSVRSSQTNMILPSNALRLDTADSLGLASTSVSNLASPSGQNTRQSSPFADPYRMNNSHYYNDPVSVSNYSPSNNVMNIRSAAGTPQKEYRMLPQSYIQQQGIATFRGNVVPAQPERNLRGTYNGLNELLPDMSDPNMKQRTRSSSVAPDSLAARHAVNATLTIHHRLDANSMVKNPHSEHSNAPINQFEQAQSQAPGSQQLYSYGQSNPSVAMKQISSQFGKAVIKHTAPKQSLFTTTAPGTPVLTDPSVLTTSIWLQSHAVQQATAKKLEKYMEGLLSKKIDPENLENSTAELSSFIFLPESEMDPSKSNQATPRKVQTPKVQAKSDHFHQLPGVTNGEDHSQEHAVAISNNTLSPTRNATNKSDDLISPVHMKSSPSSRTRVAQANPALLSPEMAPTSATNNTTGSTGTKDPLEEVFGQYKQKWLSSRARWGLEKFMQKETVLYHSERHYDTSAQEWFDERERRREQSGRAHLFCPIRLPPKSNIKLITVARQYNTYVPHETPNPDAPTSNYSPTTITRTIQQSPMSHVGTLEVPAPNSTLAFLKQLNSPPPVASQTPLSPSKSTGKLYNRGSTGQPSHRATSSHSIHGLNVNPQTPSRRPSVSLFANANGGSGASTPASLSQVEQQNSFGSFVLPPAATTEANANKSRGSLSLIVTDSSNKTETSAMSVFAPPTSSGVLAMAGSQDFQTKEQQSFNLSKSQTLFTAGNEQQQKEDCEATIVQTNSKAELTSFLPQKPEAVNVDSISAHTIAGPTTSTPSTVNRSNYASIGAQVSSPLSSTVVSNCKSSSVSPSYVIPVSSMEGTPGNDGNGTPVNYERKSLVTLNSEIVKEEFVH